MISDFCVFGFRGKFTVMICNSRITSTSKFRFNFHLSGMATKLSDDGGGRAGAGPRVRGRGGPVQYSSGAEEAPPGELRCLPTRVVSYFRF